MKPLRLILVFIFSSLIISPALSNSKSLPEGRRPSRLGIKISNNLTDRPLDSPRGLFAEAQVDTYFLAEYDFDSGGQPDMEGWIGVDLTAQIDTFFHVDDFAGMGGGLYGQLAPISGQNSLWCGAPASANEPYCSYATLPGYGNQWSQFFESVDFPVEGDATLSYEVSWDSEQSYDYSTVLFKDTSGTWTAVNVRGIGFYDGRGNASETYVISSGKTGGHLQLRFKFESDGVYSDEDGLWNSDGAIILDNISVSDTTGLLNFQDFEGEAVGATRTLDGTWTAATLPAFGDFSSLFSGMSTAQDDECTKDMSFLWGFFKGSTEYYIYCGPPLHPEQPVVPRKKYFPEHYLTQYIKNEVWSPWIEWNPGGTVPAAASGAVLDYWVYRDLPLDNLVFYVSRIRSKTGAGGCPGPWRYNSSIYYGVGYGGAPDWFNQQEPVGDFIDPGATHVQIALGCWDLCGYWCGIYGGVLCRTHSPLFDNVKLYRINTNGPVWNVGARHLFQDNFPSGGSTTGTVRMDMAQDRAGLYSSVIYPGDSIVVSVASPNSGMGTDPTYGGAAVYAYVRSSGGEAGAVMTDDQSRYPLVSGPDAAGFYKFRMDTSYTDAGMTNPIQNEFCFDLNDNLFSPPDRVDFYFSASDAAANTTYWSEFIKTTGSEAKVQTQPMEAQCLPTGTADILYVDDYDQWGAQPYFDTAFEFLGILPDRYDVRSPSSMVANGPGARAAPNQVTDVYKVIIWNSGNLGYGTIGDGSGEHEKSPDAQLLSYFLDMSSIWNPGLYITGDNIASELKNASSAPYLDLFGFIDYNLTSNDHVSMGEPVSPLVTATGISLFCNYSPYTPDTLISYGGCPGGIKAFDVIEPAGPAQLEMAYADNPAHGAVISQQTVNSQTKTARVILEGFSYHYIRDDRPNAPADRFEHLKHILNWFEVTTPATGNQIASAPANKLEQNYPNPFNPVTTIIYSLKERSHVSLKIYDASGRLVKTLVDGVRDAGENKRIVWRGHNDSGEPVSSGVYFCRLTAKGFNASKKLVLMK